MLPGNATLIIKSRTSENQQPFVLAAGNYKFREFALIGFPCQLWLIGTVIIIFALEDTIGIAIAIFAACLAVMLGGVKLRELVSLQCVTKLSDGS